MRPPKRAAVWVGAVIGAGSLFLLGGMLQSAGTAGLASARAMAAPAKAVCSLATLHGTYNFATESVSAPGAVPFAYAGFVTYDGKGDVSEVYTISVNGSVSRSVTETGTYTVNPDCTGSEVDSGAGSIGTQHYDEFLSPDGSQFAYIQTDSGAVSAGMLFRTVKPSGG